MTADPGTELIDPVLAERARAAYRARDVLFGVEWDVRDMLIVADWLLTGRADLALVFDAALAGNYPNVDDEPDASATAQRPVDVHGDVPDDALPAD